MAHNSFIYPFFPYLVVYKSVAMGIEAGQPWLGKGHNSYRMLGEKVYKVTRNDAQAVTESASHGTSHTYVVRNSLKTPPPSILQFLISNSFEMAPSGRILPCLYEPLLADESDSNTIF